jgi:hypothetical protein
MPLKEVEHLFVPHDWRSGKHPKFLDPRGSWP